LQAAALALKASAKTVDAAGVVQETESEEEPSWELSEDLREFTGDPSDRKAQLLFKQLQQVP
jgi:hypothetical protein